WYVRHARRILQERGPNPAVHAALVRMLNDNPDETRRLRALWALGVTGGLTEERLLASLDDPSPWVRGWTIQFLRGDDTKPVSSAAKSKLISLAETDPSPVVRLYLSSLLGRMAPANRWEILTALVRHADDASDHNLPLMYWYAAEPLAAVDPQRLLTITA